MQKKTKFSLLSLIGIISIAVAIIFLHSWALGLFLLLMCIVAGYYLVTDIREVEKTAVFMEEQHHQQGNKKARKTDRRAAKK